MDNARFASIESFTHLMLAFTKVLFAAECLLVNVYENIDSAENVGVIFLENADVELLTIEETMINLQSCKRDLLQRGQPLLMNFLNFQGRLRLRILSTTVAKKI